MKRFWMTAFLMTGLFAVLAAPVAAKSSDENSSDESSSEAIEDVNSAMGNLSSRLADVEKKLGLTFYGDVRARYAFIGQASSVAGVTILDSSRGRYRARLGVSKNFGDFSGNFRVATGATNNPNSENNTFDSAFENPAINIDTATVTYIPSALGGHVKLMAGKMVNPLTKTPISWDADIQPEGALLELSDNDLKLRATYFELANEAAKTVPDQLMNNVQLEDMFKIDADTGVGLMAGYEYIPNATSLLTTISQSLAAPTAANLGFGMTNDGNILDAGNVMRNWNVVEGMLTFKHKVGSVPFKWTIHGTDNLNGKNLPNGLGKASGAATLFGPTTGANGTYSSTFTNQYALWVGVDIGTVANKGDFAGTLAFATLDPNAQLAFLTDDDGGFTNRQYAFGALTYGLEDKVQLKVSQWLIGHEYYAYLGNPANNSSPGGAGRNLEYQVFVDCIANF